MRIQFHDLIYEKRDGVARLTLNRPETYNAFTDQTLRELIHVFNDAGLDDSIGVVVLTGSGDKAFCSGGDVSWERAGGLERLRTEPLDIHGAMRHCPKPIIARVNGYAIGAGNHMAYFCDFTIAAEHAIFGQNGPRVGSPAGGHIVSYLVRVVGAKKAREMWMLCRRYTAREALDMGLVNAVVPYAKLDEEVNKWCQEILALSPTCLKILKASFEAEYDDLRGQTTQFQRLIAPHFFTSGEGLEGATAFLERRQPDFSRFRQRGAAPEPAPTGDPDGAPAIGVHASCQTEIRLTFPVAGVGFQVHLERPEEEAKEVGADSGRLLIQAVHGSTQQVLAFEAATSPVLADFLGGFTRWLGTKGITAAVTEQGIQGTFKGGMAVPQVCEALRDICQMLSDKFALYQHSVLADP